MQVQTQWNPEFMPVWPATYDPSLYKASRDMYRHGKEELERGHGILEFIRDRADGATPVEAAMALKRSIPNARASFSKLLAEDRIHKIKSNFSDGPPRYAYGGSKHE